VFNDNTIQYVIKSLKHQMLKQIKKETTFS